MSAYLAVIKDSFREAMASRVLWILLILITLLLVGLAPLGWTVRSTSTIRNRDVRDFDSLAKRLVEGGTNSEDDDSLTKQEQIWEQLSTDLRGRLKEHTKVESEERDRQQRRLQRDLVEELNKLVASNDIYDPKLWSVDDLDEEGRELADGDSSRLTSIQRNRLDYLALNVAYPGMIRKAADTSIMFHYLVWDFGEPIPISEDRLRDIVGLTIAGFSQVLVGRLGVFAAILVTASIIPNVFDAGSVSLLLSKPISRPLLFLAKFVGGCWFVLINAVYLVAGVWLLVGTRLGIWNHGLLWCIPVFLFLFAVYYSISAVSGLIWRNTIVCVVMTIIFWFVCTVVASVKQSLELFMIQPNRIKHVVPESDLVFATTERGQLLQWSPQEGNWTERYQLSGPMVGPAMGNGPQLIGPVYDQPNEQLVFVQNRWGQCKTFVAKKADEWQPVEGVSAPFGSLKIIKERDGKLLVLNQQGLFRLPDLVPTTPENRPMEILGFKIPLGQKNESYLPVIQDRSIEFGDDCTIAMAAGQDTLYHWRAGKLTRLSRTVDGQYSAGDAHKIGGDRQSAIIAVGGNNIVVALGDGAIKVLNATNYDEVSEHRPDGQNQPRFAVASPDGRWFAVAFHTGKLWVYDAEDREVLRVPGIRQGDVSAVNFSADGKLHVADRGRRVTSIGLPTGEKIDSYSAPLDIWRKLYYYAVIPLHTVFPKPGELENTINYLLSERETVAADPASSRLDTARIKTDPWAPVWSSLVFTLIVLAFGCYYVQKQEF